MYFVHGSSLTKTNNCVMGAVTLNLFEYIFDMVLLPPLTKFAGLSPLSINLEVALSLEIFIKTYCRLFLFPVPSYLSYGYINAIDGIREIPKQMLLFPTL